MTASICSTLTPSSQIGTAARVANARFYRFATKKLEDLGFRTTKAASYLGIDLSADRKWLYYTQVDSSTSELYLVENLPCERRRLKGGTVR